MRDRCVFVNYDVAADLARREITLLSFLPDSNRFLI